MKYINRIWIVILCILGLASCSEQQIETYKYEEINWSIEIPFGFKRISSKEWGKVKENGKHEIEKSLNKDLTNKDAEITLMVYKIGPFHTIEANVKKSNTKLKHKNNINELNRTTFESLASAMPNTTLDSTSSKFIIDGKEFVRHEIDINYDNGSQLISNSYRRVIGDNIFSINTLHKSQKKGKDILNSILNSKIK